MPVKLIETTSCVLSERNKTMRYLVLKDWFIKNHKTIGDKTIYYRVSKHYSYLLELDKLTFKNNIWYSSASEGEDIMLSTVKDLFLPTQPIYLCNPNLVGDLIRAGYSYIFKDSESCRYASKEEPQYKEYEGYVVDIYSNEIDITWCSSEVADLESKDSLIELHKIRGVNTSQMCKAQL